jgi:hypothetical protein
MPPKKKSKTIPPKATDLISRANNIKDLHGSSGNTQTAYAGYLSRGREFLKNLPLPTPAPGESPETYEANLADHAELQAAFDGVPNLKSAEALAMYMTFKCDTEQHGKSTLDGTYSALKGYWAKMCVFFFSLIE